MRHFHYAFEDGEVLRVTARRRPSEKTKPRSTTWVVMEMLKDEWRVPSFPEITWGQLKALTYLGSIPAKEEK